MKGSRKFKSVFKEEEEDPPSRKYKQKYRDQEDDDELPPRKYK
jgi:hypothetical protein